MIIAVWLIQHKCAFLVQFSLYNFEKNIAEKTGGSFIQVVGWFYKTIFILGWHFTPKPVVDLAFLLSVRCRPEPYYLILYVRLLI